MAFVVSLVGNRPSPRYDALIWTQARIEEATAAAGPWSEVETFALPAYPDPENPPLFNFTTALATNETGYYRIVFIDAALAEQASGAIFSSGIRPTAVDIRDWSQVDFDGLGWVAEGGVDPLDRLITWSIDWITLKTDKELTGDLEPKYASAYQQAIQMLVEWTAYRSQPDFIEDNADFDLISEFTAGDYSEKRRGIGAAVNALHPFPPLNDLLGFLSGATNGNDASPAVGLQEVNWTQQRDDIFEQPYGGFVLVTPSHWIGSRWG